MLILEVTHCEFDTLKASRSPDLRPVAWMTDARSLYDILVKEAVTTPLDISATVLKQTGVQTNQVQTRKRRHVPGYHILVRAKTEYIRIDRNKS